MQQTQQVKFKVLVGDTSVRSRLVLSGLINAEPFLEVVDTAQTKEELLYKSVSTRPDLIVAHHGLMKSGHLPAFTAICNQDSALLLMASHAYTSFKFSQASPSAVFGQGASEMEDNKVLLPECSKKRLMHKLREFVMKHTMGKAIGTSRRIEDSKGKFSRLVYSQEDNLSVSATPLNLIVLGASTGGSTAIEYLIKDLHLLPSSIILVAVHMPEKFTRRLAQRLQKLTHWRVIEGAQGMTLEPNTIIIAPGGHHMRVAAKPFRPNVLTLEVEASEALDTPSVDELMASAAHWAQERVLGVIMTGMGQDGSLGAKEIIKKGGLVIAQDKATSSIYGMAKAAVESGAVHGVFALGQINSIINRFVADRNRSHMIQRTAIG